MALVAAVLVLGCNDDFNVCDDKATIWIVNNTICTPDIRVNGDLLITDLAPLDSMEFLADEGTQKIQSNMAFISLCVDREEDISTLCGEEYRFLVFVE